MEESSRKRPCLGISQVSAILSAPCPSLGESTFQNLSEEVLIEIFRYTDLPSRIRLRRVRRYWKHVLLLPEVNAVIHVDAARNLVRQWKQSEADSTLSLQSDKVPVFRRLFGSHVRFVSYNGWTDRYSGKTWSLDISEDINWIRAISPNVQHIFVRGIWFREDRLVLPSFGAAMVQFFRDCFGDEPSDRLRSLTFEDVRYAVWFQFGFENADDEYYDDDAYGAEPHQYAAYSWDLEVPTRFTIFDDGADLTRVRSATDSVIWPFPDEQTAWVAQYAPKLVKGYRDWPPVQLSEIFGLEEGELPDLQSLDYRSVDRQALWIMARCILDHKHGRTNSLEISDPPYAFPANFLERFSILG